MALHNQFGKKGEMAAAEFLKRKGYEVLIMNWQHKKFEIDIIAKIGGEIVFVEVKSRKSRVFGNAEMAVSGTKQKHLIAGAEYYLNEHEIDLDARFDVVSVYAKNNGSFEIEHIVDAFGPEW